LKQNVKRKKRLHTPGMTHAVAYLELEKRGIRLLATLDKI